MKPLIINVHSFVDLITNSSTEIYIHATDRTVTAIKTIVNNLLQIAGSSKTCDDLFAVELDYVHYKEYYSDYYDTGDERLQLPPEEFYDRMNEDGLRGSLRVKVTPLISGEQAKETAGILASLSGLFDKEARYN